MMFLSLLCLSGCATSPERPPESPSPARAIDAERKAPISEQEEEEEDDDDDAESPASLTAVSEESGDAAEEGAEQVKKDLARFLAPNPSFVPYPPRQVEHLAVFIPYFYWILQYKSEAPILAIPVSGEKTGAHFLGELYGTNPVQGGQWRTIDAFGARFTLGMEFKLDYLVNGESRSRIFRFDEMLFIGDMGFKALLSFPPRRQTETAFFLCGQKEGSDKRFCKRTPAIAIVQTGRDNKFFPQVVQELSKLLKETMEYLPVEAEKLEPRARAYTTVYFVSPEDLQGEELAKEYNRREKEAQKLAEILKPLVGQVDIREWTFTSPYALLVYVGNAKGAMGGVK
jgi:hypothetical protein